MERVFTGARAKEISDFTGISSAYEPPESPDLEVRTDLLTVQASVALVLEAVENRIRSVSNSYRNSVDGGA